jgi:hypothetical protein
MKNLLVILCLLAAVGCNSENKQKNRNTAPKLEKAKLIAMKVLKDDAIETERKSECSKSAEAAENAYKYAMRAMNAESLDDIQDNSKNAMQAFGDARKYAGKCGCTKTNAVADEGFMISKQAYQAGNLRDALNYAQEARKVADELLASADNCSDK